MNTYLNDSLKDKLKELRIYELETKVKWGNRRRIFKMVGGNEKMLEIAKKYFLKVDRAFGKVFNDLKQNEDLDSFEFFNILNSISMELCVKSLGISLMTAVKEEQRSIGQIHAFSRYLSPRFSS